MEFKTDKSLAQKKEKSIKIRKLVIITLAGLCGIAISVFSLLQSNIQLNIIIFSVTFTIILFSLIVYFIFIKMRKHFINYDQKIILNENELIYEINNKTVQLLYTQIKSVQVIRNRNGIISQIIVNGPHKIIIQGIIENIGEVLAEIEKRINPTIIKNRKFIYLNIFIGIGTALIFILIYIFKYRYNGNVLGIILDKLIPITGGILLLVLVYLNRIPGKVKLYKLLAISLILFSILSIFFEISDLKDNKIEVVDGYTIVFPTEPKIEKKEINNALLTSYSCQSNNSSYLVEKYKLNSISIADPEYYFKDLAENYAKTTNTNIDMFDYNDEMMSLTLISENRDVFIEIKRIIVSEHILLNSIIYTKTERGLNTPQSNNFSKSIIGK